MLFRIFFRTAFAFLVLQVFLLSSFSQGQTVIDWDAPFDRSYGNSASWTGEEVPDTISESAQFNLNATYNVAFDDDFAISDLRVLDGNVTFFYQSIPFDLRPARVLSINDDAIVESSSLSLGPVAPILAELPTFFVNIADELDIADFGVLRLESVS